MPSLSLFLRDVIGGPPAGMGGPPAGMTGPPPGVTGGPPPGVAGKPGSRPDFAMPQGSISTLSGLIAMFLIICTSVVVLRIASRRLTKQALGADDCWILGALVLFFGQATVICYNLKFLSDSAKASKAAIAGGMVKKPDFVMVLRLKLGASLLYVCALTAARCSLLFLYKRVFGHRVAWFKVAWWLAISTTVIYLIVFFAISLAACAGLTMKKDWPRDLPPGSCAHDRYYRPEPFAYANAAIELVMLTLPIRMIWTLQMSRRQKLGISGVFGLGIAAVIVSFARAISISTNSSFSSSHGAFMFLTWSTVEPAMVIICACLPIIRPIVIRGVKAVGGSGTWITSRLSSRKQSRQYALSSSVEGGEKLALTGSSSRSILAVTSTEQTFGLSKEINASVTSTEIRSSDSYVYSPKVKTFIEARDIKALPPPPACRMDGKDGDLGERVRYFRR